MEQKNDHNAVSRECHDVDVDACYKRCQCSIVEQLQSEREFYRRSLPIAPAEPPHIELLSSLAEVGCVDSPPCPPSSALSLTQEAPSVTCGRRAAFFLSPIGGVASCYVSTHSLSSLAAVALVELVVQQGDRCGLAELQLLPVTYEPSDTLGCVVVRLSESPLHPTPEGCHIVVRRATVAGCDLGLGESLPAIAVAFNHASVPKGPLWAAAQARDANIAVMKRMLEDGTSTEETDNVSLGVSCVVVLAVRDKEVW
jgi:hypothetical protein